jgi:hypothetical protein
MNADLAVVAGLTTAQPIDSLPARIAETKNTEIAEEFVSKVHIE